MSLKNWMESAGVGASELALRLGVTRQAIYAWLWGKAYPSLPHLLKLEEISGGIVTAASFASPVAGKEAQHG